MTTYRITSQNEIEIDFHGIKPDAATRKKMKDVKIWWNPNKSIWHGPVNNQTFAVAKDIGGESENKDYALKLKIKVIIAADESQFETWGKILKDYVNDVMSEDNASHSSNSVSKSQEFVWLDCFQFIAKHLSELSKEQQDYELVFEYSLPGTVHERPDVFLLTDKKVISLEFKRKEAPQVDDNKDDVAQAIRYKEWLENHHQETKKRNLEVKSFLVCTHKNASAGELRSIKILTGSNLCSTIAKELSGEKQCSFIDEWLSSEKTAMPDMLQAIEIMYREGRIPYISDVNRRCLDTVLHYVDGAKKQHKKVLILVNGVPGAGKTAVGQSVVFEQNKNREANAVYLSGNGPLVEVLQYQINKVGKNKHMAENAIQGMKEFKNDYFSKYSRQNCKVPEQSILVFDEAQRAWDTVKMNRGFSEPEGLFDVGDRIFAARNYAVVIGLYGNGQVIYEGEEKGLEIWEDALKKHNDWYVIVAEELAGMLTGVASRRIIDNNLFLPISLRADFIDCNKWVKKAISRKDASLKEAQIEFAKLQETSLRICITRDVSKVVARTREIDLYHPEWRYGIIISSFAEQNVVKKAFPGWDIRKHGNNVVKNGSYGKWYDGECKKLDKACTVYGNQGLELDCPIVLFGGGYIRQNGRWVPNGSSYDRQKNMFQNPEAIVENHFRVLLTRARKEMILLIPDDRILDDTYQYFIDMGMDEL